jgi:hypothetical protein
MGWFRDTFCQYHQKQVPLTHAKQCETFTSGVRPGDVPAHLYRELWLTKNTQSTCKHCVFCRDFEWRSSD